MLVERGAGLLEQFGHLTADLFFALLQLRNGAGMLAEQAQPFSSERLAWCHRPSNSSTWSGLAAC